MYKFYEALTCIFICKSLWKQQVYKFWEACVITNVYFENSRPPSKEKFHIVNINTIIVGPKSFVSKRIISKNVGKLYLI